MIRENLLSDFSLKLRNKLKKYASLMIIGNRMKKGFTLIELLITVTLFGSIILTTGVIDFSGPTVSHPVAVQCNGQVYTNSSGVTLDITATTTASYTLSGELFSGALTGRVNITGLQSFVPVLLSGGDGIKQISVNFRTLSVQYDDTSIFYDSGMMGLSTTELATTIPPVGPSGFVYSNSGFLYLSGGQICMISGTQIVPITYIGNPFNPVNYRGPVGEIFMFSGAYGYVAPVDLYTGVGGSPYVLSGTMFTGESIYLYDSGGTLLFFGGPLCVTGQNILTGGYIYTGLGSFTGTSTLVITTGVIPLTPIIPYLAYGPTPMFGNPLYNYLFEQYNYFSIVLDTISPTGLQLLIPNNPFITGAILSGMGALNQVLLGRSGGNDLNFSHYHVEVSTQSGSLFTGGIVFSGQTLSGIQSLTAINLLLNTPYYWRVLGIDCANNTGYSAQEGQFIFLPYCTYNQTEGMSCTSCDAGQGLSNVGAGLCCYQGQINSGGVCAPVVPICLFTGVYNPPTINFFWGESETGYFISGFSFFINGPIFTASGTTLMTGSVVDISGGGSGVYNYQITGFGLSGYTATCTGSFIIADFLGPTGSGADGSGRCMGLSGDNLLHSGSVWYSATTSVNLVLNVNQSAYANVTGDIVSSILGRPLMFGNNTTGIIFSGTNSLLNLYSIYYTGSLTPFLCTGNFFVDTIAPSIPSTVTKSTLFCSPLTNPFYNILLKISRTGSIDSGAGLSGYQRYFMSGMSEIISGSLGSQSTGVQFSISGIPGQNYTFVLVSIDKVGNVSTGIYLVEPVCPACSLSITGVNSIISGSTIYTNQTGVFINSLYNLQYGSILRQLNGAVDGNYTGFEIMSSGFTTGIINLSGGGVITMTNITTQPDTSFFCSLGYGIDTTPPTPITGALDNSGNLLISYNITCPGGLNVTRSGMTDSGVGFSGYEYRLLSGNIEVESGYTTTTGLIQTGLENATYTILIRGFDLLGNTGTRFTGSQNMVIDCMYSCNVQLSGVQTFISGGITYIDQTGVTLDLYASPIAERGIIINGLVPPTLTGSLSGSYSTGIISLPYDNGYLEWFFGVSGWIDAVFNTFAYSINDFEGCTGVIIYQIDDIPPTVGTGGSGLSVSLTGAGLCAPVSISRSGSVDTGVGLSYYERTLMSGSTILSSGQAGSGSIGMIIPSIANGTYVFELVAVDRFGNRSTGTVVFTVNCPSSGPQCMNGIIEGAEQCDDGNNNDGDACKNTCTPNTCACGGTYPNCNSCNPGCFGSCGWTPPPPPNPPKHTAPIVYPTLSLAIEKACAYADKPYQDIRYIDLINYSYRNSIEVLTNLCIVRGRYGEISTREYVPHGYVQIDEFIKMLIKILLINDGSWFSGEGTEYIGELPYYDMKKDDWSANYVGKYLELGFDRLLGRKRMIGGKEVLLLDPMAPMPKNIAMILVRQAMLALGKKSSMQLGEIASVDGYLLRGPMTELFVKLFDLDTYFDGNNKTFLSTLLTMLNKFPEAEQKEKLVSFLNVISGIEAEILKNKFGINKEWIVKMLSQTLGINASKIENVRRHSLIGEENIEYVTYRVEEGVIEEIATFITRKDPFYRAFSLGLKAGDVGLLQKVLFVLGYYRGPLDRVFDQEVRDALFAMQKEFGILTEESPEDMKGFLGPETRKFLNDMVNKAYEKK